MKPFPAILRRVLTAALVILPLIAGTDRCAVGALIGRADLTCGMDQPAAACRAETAPPMCPHCAGAAEDPTPSPAPASGHGSTCCDLRPQAAGTGETIVPEAPATSSHPATVSVRSAVMAPVVMAAFVESDAGRSPPRESPPSLSPRAPPLA